LPDEHATALAVVAYYCAAFARLAGDASPRPGELDVVLAALRRGWTKRDLCQAIAGAAEPHSRNHEPGRGRLAQILGTDDRVDALSRAWCRGAGRAGRDPSEPEPEKPKPVTRQAAARFEAASILRDPERFAQAKRDWDDAFRRDDFPAQAEAQARMNRFGASPLPPEES
jgi:hypothetical protein